MFSDDHSIQRQKRKSLEEMFSDSDQQERGDFATDYKERREMIREMVSDSDQQERGDFSTDSEHEMEKGNQSIQHHARNRGDFSSDDQDEEDIPLYHSTKRYTTLTTTLKSPTLATRQESREVLQEYSDSFEQEEDLEELEFHQQQEHYTKDSPKNYSKDEKEDIQHKFFGQARDQTIKDLKEKEILNSHIRFKSSSVSPEQLRKGKSKDLGGEVIKKKKHKKKHKKKKETVNPLKRMFEDVQDQNKRVKM